MAALQCCSFVWKLYTAGTPFLIDERVAIVPQVLVRVNVKELPITIDTLPVVGC
ncbi:MAG: hypothetical protein ACLPVW_08455 [Terriglobales bacterium]